MGESAFREQDSRPQRQGELKIGKQAMAVVRRSKSWLATAPLDGLRRRSASLVWPTSCTFWIHPPLHPQWPAHLAQRSIHSSSLVVACSLACSVDVAILSPVGSPLPPIGAALDDSQSDDNVLEAYSDRQQSHGSLLHASTTISPSFSSQAARNDILQNLHGSATGFVKTGYSEKACTVTASSHTTATRLLQRQSLSIYGHAATANDLTQPA